MPSFPPVRPHGPLAEVFPNVFVVTGALKVGPFVATRNMTVLRQGQDLTLLNSVRLDDAGERALAALGRVKHLVRLGFFHGMDDPYIMERYAPTFWSGERMKPQNVEAARRNDLVDGGLPFGTGFRFRAGRFDEAAVLLDVAGGVLVTCDSIQNVTTTAGCNLLGGLMLRAAGLVGGVRVGGPWAKQMTGGKPERLRADFGRLAALPFAHLISAHGVPVRATAMDDVRAATARGLGPG